METYWSKYLTESRFVKSICEQSVKTLGIEIRGQYFSLYLLQKPLMRKQDLSADLQVHWKNSSQVASANSLISETSLLCQRKFFSMEKNFIRKRKKDKKWRLQKWRVQDLCNLLQDLLKKQKELKAEEYKYYWSESFCSLLCSLTQWRHVAKNV